MAYLDKKTRKWKLTPHDYKKREERRRTQPSLRFRRRRIGDAEIADHVAYLYRNRVDPKRDIINAIKDENYTIRMIRRRIHLFQKYKLTGVYQPGMSISGDMGYERWLLDEAQHDLRFYQAVARRMGIVGE